MNTRTITLLASLSVVMLFSFSVAGVVDAIQSQNAGSEAIEKSLLKEKIKDRMMAQAEKDQMELEDNIKYTPEEYGIPYNVVFEQDGKLIVGLDPVKTREFQKNYTESDVKSDLATTLDFDVNYYVFEREAKVMGGDKLTASKSATITVVKNNKIVTTGHAFKVNDVVSASSSAGNGCKEVKIVRSPDSNGAYADAAYGINMPHRTCGHNYVNNSLSYNGKTYSLSYATESDITRYKSVLIEGMSTSSSGIILYPDVTIRDPEGILHDQVLANYSSAKGDSGAPIFETTGPTTAKLLGQHVGKMCQVDFSSGTSNFYDWCAVNNGIPHLPYFSPWDQVSSHLGL